MSGHSYSNICPECECEEETLMCYCENRPYDIVNGYCVNCGFAYYTTEERLTKEELKEQQKEHGYNPKTNKFE